MVKFINRDTHTVMWVAEDRVEEYKAAGHKLAASPSAPKSEPKAEAAVKVAKKTTRKRK